MSGNVWEWTHSLYKAYPYQRDDGREGLQASGDRVLRGGSFNNDRSNARCAVRNWLNPGDFSDFIGFRVVVSPIFESEL
jgi:formylglycine-generating enzyme required for sulfatase activity